MKAKITFETEGFSFTVESVEGEKPGEYHADFSYTIGNSPVISGSTRDADPTTTDGLPFARIEAYMVGMLPMALSMVHKVRAVTLLREALRAKMPTETVEV